MQQNDATEAAVYDYVHSTKMRAEDATKKLDSLDQSILEAEVLAALKRCQQKKATGPDELPKYWYREHCAELASILCGFFNR